MGRDDPDACREQAAAERALAAAEPLPMARERHLSAARHWENLATRAELTTPGRGRADG